TNSNLPTGGSMMKKDRIGLTVIALCAALGISTAMLAQPIPIPPTLAGAAAGPAQGHPEIQAALSSLQAARNHLHTAATVYGNHRTNAERLTDQAIQECRAALDYAATKHVEHLPAAPPMATGQRKPVKGYPEIHQALNALSSARNDLQKAATDFGGHRVNALKFTNQAINECHAALNYVHSK
ncbi:MAG: hypothetical protein ACRD2O_16760, partial [Terriglobia bacterium]